MARAPEGSGENVQPCTVPPVIRRLHPQQNASYDTGLSLRISRDSKWIPSAREDLKMAPVYINPRKISMEDEMTLCYALISQNLQLFKTLVEKSGKDLNEPSEDGYYLVHRAATIGSVQCLEYLIQNGAKLNVYDRQGNLPLDLAVFEGEFDCARYLIQQGASINNIRYGYKDLDMVDFERCV